MCIAVVSRAQARGRHQLSIGPHACSTAATDTHRLAGSAPVSAQAGTSASRTAVRCFWTPSKGLIRRRRRSVACWGSLGAAQLWAAACRATSNPGELAVLALSCLLWRSAAEVRPAARRNCLMGVSDGVCGTRVNQAGSNAAAIQQACPLPICQRPDDFVRQCTPPIRRQTAAVHRASDAGSSSKPAGAPGQAWTPPGCQLAERGLLAAHPRTCTDTHLLMSGGQAALGQPLQCTAPHSTLEASRSS